MVVDLLRPGEKAPDGALKTQETLESDFEHEVAAESDLEHHSASASVGERTESLPAVPEVKGGEAAFEVQRTPLLVQIEEKLSEGLVDVYYKLPKDKQTLFKKEGEKIAQKIQKDMERGTLRPHELLKETERWVEMIPGVNKWFLKQQVKVKVDALQDLDREHQKNRLNAM